MADYDALVDRNQANVAGELGLDFDLFHSKLREIAYTSSSNYFKIQRAFNEQITRDISAGIEQTIYNALTRGLTFAGNPIIVYGGRPQDVAVAFRNPGDPVNIQPRMPPEKAKQISLSFAKTFVDNIKSKIINELFPPDILQSALNRSRP